MCAIVQETKVNDVPENEKEKHWPQILAILIGSICGLTEGLNSSWTSPFLQQILDDKEMYDVSEKQGSYFNTVFLLGTIIGCPFFSIFSDKIGRKKTFLFAAVLQILGWIFAGLAKDVYLFYASRLCTGMSSSCFLSVFPIYIGEITNPTVRGKWGIAVSSSLYIGQMMINIIGCFFGVQMASVVCLPLPVLFFILFSLMPESPYFCIMKGKEEEAKRSLKFFTRKINIDKDYLRLKCDVDRQLSESTSWGSLLKIKSNRKALFAGSFLRISQQTSGILIFLLYTQTIFQRAGVVNSQLSSIIFTGTNVVFNLIVMFFIVHRFGRRVLYIYSLLGSAITLYLLGTYFYLEENKTVDLSSFTWVPIAGMITFQIFASFGLYVIPTLMMSELFSASIKSKAMTWVIIVMAVGNIILNSVFFYTVEFIGFYAPFYMYAICNTISAILSFYIIPETKGKTLETIQQMLKKKKVLKD